MAEYLSQLIEWTKLKVRIHLSERIIYFREREIWWASLGVNIGYEQNGKNKNFERPILVLKKFNQDIMLILPLTSKFEDSRFYYPIEYKQKRYSVILSQLRLISGKRLIRKIRKISEAEYLDIRKAVINLL
jgi:mRNA interferase MazF